jgi:hypothetical protein
MTGEKTLALNPFLYGPITDELGLNVDAVFLYGFTPKMDMIANLSSLSVIPEFGYGGSWIMPRVDLGKNNILGFQVGMIGRGDGYYAVPQYHFFIENSKFAFEFNVGANFNFEALNMPSIYGIVAPVYKIFEGILHLYVEVDPSFIAGVSDSFGLTVVPGLWLGLAGGKHQFSAGIPLGGITSDAMTTSFACWYWTTFSL